MPQQLLITNQNSDLDVIFDSNQNSIFLFFIRMLDEERERREKLEEKLQGLVRNLDENCNSDSRTKKGFLEG